MHASEIFRFVYILGFVNAIFFSILIFAKKEKSQADKILASWFLVLALQLFWPFFYLSDINKYISMVGWESSIITLHPIFLYLYIKVLTNKPLTNWQIVRTFWPVPISILGSLPFFSLPDEYRKLMLEGSYMPKSLLSEFVFITVVIVYFIYKSFIALKKHKNHTLHVFSYKDNVDLLWLRRLIVTLSTILIVSLPIAAILYHFELPLAFTDFIYYMCLVGFIFFMGFWGYQQGNIFNLNQSVVFEVGETTRTDVAKDYTKEAAIIKQIMEKQQPFLDPTLTIHQLANQSNLSPHLLSKVIHKAFQKNFFEFVNDYRIQHFKKMVSLPKYKNYTLLGIALESGFNSKSAFNRIFKEQTGQTPGDYKKNLS